MDPSHLKDTIEAWLEAPSGSASVQGLTDLEADNILKGLFLRVKFAKESGAGKVRVMSLHEGDYKRGADLECGSAHYHFENLNPVARRVCETIRDAGYGLEFQRAGGPNYHVFLRFERSACL